MSIRYLSKTLEGINWKVVAIAPESVDGRALAAEVRSNLDIDVSWSVHGDRRDLGNGEAQWQLIFEPDHARD